MSLRTASIGLRQLAYPDKARERVATWGVMNSRKKKVYVMSLVWLVLDVLNTYIISVPTDAHGYPLMGCLHYNTFAFDRFSFAGIIEGWNDG